ncbi:MAG: TIGR02099 family protein, partial [Xanthomonadaceae bacterium]|nr:TIGR02099 family protein [Xanthomonadaceae bacterium]
KKFWVKHVMSPALVHWLDNALVGGWVRDGRAVISGDLDDWPFVARDGKPARGVFDARATLRDMRVKFHDDWPATSDMDADIAFIGNGFHVAGKAQLLEVGIREFSSGMEDFGHSDLTVDAAADADATKLLALMKQSPLQREHGETMAKLGAAGPASVEFSLRLPAHTKDAPPKIAGQVALRGVRLSESEWKLAFAKVTGIARYDRDGFTANGLNAVYDQQQSRLSLRAGPGHVRERRNGFEAELEATMTSDDLLDRSADMAWLKPYAKGRSRWTAGIAIPTTATKPAAKSTAKPGAKPTGKSPTAISRLQLRSDLIGTALTLPAPMDKAAGTTLPTTIDLDLPIGKGEIAVAFAQRLALRAKHTQGKLGIRAQFGTDRVQEAPPPSGLVLTGRGGTVDAIDWVTLLRGGGNAGGEALPLRRVDVSVERLRLLGGVFPETRLQVVPTTGGLAVQLDGAGLAGSVIVPDADGAAIAGRLQRLHWRSAGSFGKADAAIASPAAAAPAARDDEIDPARVPPLTLKIDDLRVMNAAFGETQFRSRPTATGMEIAQLQARAPKRRIDVTGEWSGRGAAARTRLSATAASEDFGALLDELGAGGRVGGGKGSMRFDASWAGSPMAFRPGGLEGTLKIDIKDGRLVEVEPGGTGRVLGLLSLAQLPRRLMLDFRDFFNKGFAFNKFGGTVRFDGGMARSDDMTIDGSSAQINIRGAADLRAQTFDQTIEVLPKAGNLLTAVGAIAGGPVGAAVGAVANAVLQKPIGQMTAKNYRVTGPWKDPKVEVVERPPASKPARSAKPTSG